MPLVFNDERSRIALARYFDYSFHGTSRSGENNLYEGAFLLLGLGDVYQGSPCAVPLDPRHRLFGTKYSPSRFFTRCGAVGIAGQYLCIYATDSPGGYQLVGRTVPIWGELHMSGLGEKAPWMFSLLDQIRFYPVTEEELSAAGADGTSSDLIKISDAELDLNEYEKWLTESKDDVTAVREQRYIMRPGLGHESDKAMAG
ncbi:hypothetical protein N7516_009122 [Penicillium verrucosum]|uniref:uncharacterized protein n=1 Tax=Penicillium verrucosum TaxID=60171 RepID=UPI0025453319|nr:uncharacterized protein N7516_009122 [Penicillium verrucosum]KAJ5927349.1 hypothetical protein N7516_009122 [Penicillium verrucosum]